ncbi:MAG: hypothetical protein HYZ91_04695 [Candidatus Omnitrophica bacterium]|nr:hypothetical protein [Candidatus Omnitrophota bacterium]
MTQEEIRIRSLYLFLACSQAVEQLAARLAATVPSPPSELRRALDKSLRRELGLLFRYWAAQQVWERWESHEADATHVNLALLRLFTDAFKLPRDGSGLRYASLSSLSEEVTELGRRLSDALGITSQPLLGELQGAILPWHDAIMTYTAEALALPLAQLSSGINALAERPPQAGTAA